MNEVWCPKYSVQFIHAFCMRRTGPKLVDFSHLTESSKSVIDCYKYYVIRNTRLM